MVDLLDHDEEIKAQDLFKAFDKYALHHSLRVTED